MFTVWLDRKEKKVLVKRKLEKTKVPESVVSTAEVEPEVSKENAILESRWDQMLDCLREFSELHKHGWVPWDAWWSVKSFTDVELAMMSDEDKLKSVGLTKDVGLGKWVLKHRKLLLEGGLSKRRTEKLKALVESGLLRWTEDREKVLSETGSVILGGEGGTQKGYRRGDRDRDTSSRTIAKNAPVAKDDDDGGEMGSKVMTVSKKKKGSSDRPKKARLVVPGCGSGDGLPSDQDPQMGNTAEREHSILDKGVKVKVEVDGSTNAGSDMFAGSAGESGDVHRSGALEGKYSNRSRSPDWKRAKKTRRQESLNCKVIILESKGEDTGHSIPEMKPTGADSSPPSLLLSSPPLSRTNEVNNKSSRSGRAKRSTLSTAMKDRFMKDVFGDESALLVFYNLLLVWRELHGSDLSSVEVPIDFNVTSGRDLVPLGRWVACAVSLSREEHEASPSFATPAVRFLRSQVMSWLQPGGGETPACAPLFPAEASIRLWSIELVPGLQLTAFHDTPDHGTKIFTSYTTYLYK